jgi:hypothetical protein
MAAQTNAMNVLGFIPASWVGVMHGYKERGCSINEVTASREVGARNEKKWRAYNSKNLDSLIKYG